MALSSLSTWQIGGLVCVLILIFALASRKQPDPREPPYVKETIPYFSHIYGLLRHGLGYFDLVRLVVVVGSAITPVTNCYLVHSNRIQSSRLICLDKRITS